MLQEYLLNLLKFIINNKWCIVWIVVDLIMVKNKKIIELKNKNKELKEQLDVLRDRLYSYEAMYSKWK